MKIYVFGNPLVKKDSIPLQLLPELKRKFPKIEFILVDPNENFPPENEKNLVILDTIIGVKKPMLLDLKDFTAKKNTPISPHDYDLLLHLLLLKKMKKINSVRIIGITVKFHKRTFSVILNLIQNLLNRSRFSSG